MGGAPIWIDCEGSGHPGHVFSRVLAICKMCGWVLPLDDDGNIESHDRDDFIARIERGDFDQ